jgi:hypothetical protein
MTLLDLTAAAINKAMEEFDRLGRDAFLEKYGFGRTREYVLQKDGRSYYSKAIAGAAHGYLPGRSTLTASEFSGGEATVQKTLDSLGFKVVGPDAETLPPPETVLNNDEIGRRFAVGNMGGCNLAQNHKTHLLVLISDPFKGCIRTGGKVGKMVLCMHTNTSVAVGYRGALEGSAKAGIKNVELNATLVDEFLKTDTLDGARKVLTDNGLTVVHGGVSVDGLLEPNSDRARSIENLKRPRNVCVARPEEGLHDQRRNAETHNRRLKGRRRQHARRGRDGQAL